MTGEQTNQQEKGANQPAPVSQPPLKQPIDQINTAGIAILNAVQDGGIKKEEKRGYPPDYRRRRMNKMREIESFLMESNSNSQSAGAQRFDQFASDAHYMDERDYHMGDFVFQLRNPDHPNFSQLSKVEQSSVTQLSYLPVTKVPTVKFSRLSMMADIVLHTDTPFESIRAENHLISLAMFRIFKRISDYIKIRDDQNQEDYLAAKAKYNAPTEKEFMLAYSTDQLGVFESIPKPPKDRKKNRQYKKSNMIVDDQGYAKTLKNDIKIPLANSLVSSIRKTSDTRLPYLVRDSKTGKWSRTENPVSDFTTLFKNYLIYKLTAQGGFKIRQVLSNDGVYIFLVLYTSFENLKVQASIMGLNKTFSLASTDIFSLEPVDSKLRPLRLNYQLKLLTPDIKESEEREKYHRSQKEREKREQVKKELYQEKYKKVLQKEMVKYKNHKLISPSDYEKLFDINLTEVTLSETQVDNIINKQMKLKYVDQVEEARKSLLFKSKALASQIKKERKTISKLILNEIESIPLLQHSALARKYLNKTFLSKFQLQSQHDKLFNVKLEVLKHLFNINLKSLSHECRCEYLQSTEEIQDNSEESLKQYEAYNGYLELLDKYVNQVRVKYQDKEEYQLDSTQLKSILTSKREVSTQSITSRINKINKSFVCKKIKTSTADQPLDVYIPALNWNMNQGCQKQQEYQDAFIRALEEAKQQYGSYIKSIWDFYGIPFQQVFTDFAYVPSLKKVDNKIMIENSWQRTLINVGKKYEIFNKMERIKITTAILVSLLDFSKLKTQENLIYEFFPLHDNFQLFGTRKHSDIYRSIIEDRIQTDYVDEKIQSEKLQESKAKYEENLKDKKFLSELCLIPNWSTLFPFLLPEQEICDYFGEKITLYFIFLSFYLKRSLVVAILSAPVFFVYQWYETEEFGTGPQVAALCHIVLVIIWANVFCGEWNARETEFALKYGQNTIDDSEEDIRPGFKGEYERSITSNKLNEYSFDKSKTFFTERVTWFCIFIALIVNIVIIYALIYLMVYFEQNDIIQNGDHMSFESLNVLVPTAILEFIFLIEEIIFRKLALYSCDKANFKTNKDYEQSYATKVFAFIFINHLVPPTLIAFIIDQNIGCVNDDCLYHLTAYVRSYQYIIVVKNFFEIFYPFLLYSVSSVVKIDISKMYRKGSTMNEISAKEKLFEKVNSEIERQSNLSSSVVDGVDLLTRDYIEIFSYFCFNVTYGFAFPMVFAITYGLTLLKLAVSKNMYSHRLQRPNPQNASTIGVFNVFMNIGSSVSILTYTGVFCFTRTEEPDNWPFNQLTSFMFLAFIFFIIKFLIGRYYSDVDSKTADLQKRQQFILDAFSNKALSSNQSLGKADQMTPFLKIYGTSLEDKNSLLTKKTA